MENLSLNDEAHNQQSLQIATRNDNEDSDFLLHQYVFDDIFEDSKKLPIKRRYTSVRDLRAIFPNQIIGEPSPGVRTKSSLRTESNLALILEVQPECIDEALQD